MHCCHPYFHALGLEGCARASVYIYNTKEEAKVFTDAVRELSASIAKKR
jgi:cysteine desulfurase/selenocysteine lyase